MNFSCYSDFILVSLCTKINKMTQDEQKKFDELQKQLNTRKISSIVCAILLILAILLRLWGQSM